MKSHCVAALLFCLFYAAFASGEELLIPVPNDNWAIRLDAPKLSQESGAKNSIFYGRADRFQLSFFVEPPRCTGGDSDENIYDCFAKAIQQDPIVEWDTERANTVPAGVLVMYMAKLEVNGNVGRSMNMHILFARNGKWADVHGSIASPTAEDVEKLFAIMNSIKVEDRASAP